MAQAFANEHEWEAAELTPKLMSRLQELPGIDSVTVDLTDTGGGINVRLEPGADEVQVMERLRELLVAYGIRSADPRVELGRSERLTKRAAERAAERAVSFGVDVVITPLRSGARVEVATKKVRSFRVVPADPRAIAQGLSDAWCQVIGRVPVEVFEVSVDDNGQLTVMTSDGETETLGSADVNTGWERALTQAIREALAGYDDSPNDVTPVPAHTGS